MKYNNTEFINKRTNKNKLLKKILYLVIFSAIIISIYNIFLLRISNDEEEQKYVFGMKAFVIETDSMEPELEIGDVIIVKQCKRENLKIGDIITFTNRGELITHRISGIDEKTQRYSTKGDKNTLNDVETVKFEEIEGVRILTLPGFWKFINNAKNIMYGFLLFVIIITLFLHNRRNIRKRQLRRMKKKGEDKRIRDYEKNNTDNN